MNKQPKITPIFQNVQDVGKNIKQSKKRFTWVFQIDAKMYNFILDASMISGKMKLTCNDKIVAMTQQQPVGSFQHTMTLDDCLINILAVSQSFQLRINNKAFSHLLCQQKTQVQFVRNSQACEDFVIDQKISQPNTPSQTGLKKTIKLRIGSIKTNSTKPSTKGLQSQDWSKMMSGQQMQFPNYFEAHNSTATPSQQVDLTKVSMKKKVQSQPTTSQSNSANLLEMEAPVFQITPQQFSTMQQLFRTQAMQNVTVQKTETCQQSPILSQNKISQNSMPCIPGMNLNDFNTMQLMFQSQCGTPNQTVCENTSVTQKSTQTTQPVQISINLQDFNTMQMMFKTMNFGTSFAPPKQQSMPLSAQSLLSGFSTPSTETKQNSGVKTQSCPLTTLDNFNMSDFNTMQKMFATNMNPLVLNLDLQNKKQEKTIAQPKFPPMTDMSLSTKNPLTTSSQPNILDFSTMANLFKTMNFTPSPPTQNVVQTQKKVTSLTPPLSSFMTGNNLTTNKSMPSTPLQCLGLLNTSNNMNISNINLNDFNTMQQMFKTNGSGLSNNNIFSAEMFGTQTQKTQSVQNQKDDLKENSIPFEMNLI